MKFAYIFGSNVFTVPSDVIYYVDNDLTNEFLKIRSVRHSGTAGSELRIDAELKDTEGRGLQIRNNDVVTSFGYTVSRTTDRIWATGLNSSIVLDIEQLSRETIEKLDGNIRAELDREAPDAIIRISGDFMMGKMHVAVEDSRLLIGQDCYESESKTGSTGVKFTPSGLVVA